MDACEDVKPDQEVKAWRTPSTLWIPLLKVKTTVCPLLQLQTRLKNYKGNGENMSAAIVSLFLDYVFEFLCRMEIMRPVHTIVGLPL